MVFTKPNAETLAQREYGEVQRALLEAERMQAYYTKMVEFYRDRITHLEHAWKIKNQHSPAPALMSFSSVPQH